LNKGGRDMEKIKITVDLKNNIAKIVKTEIIPIFSENKFRIEGDNGGFSRIEKENGKYYIRNYLYSKEGLKMIENKKLSKKEVEKMIEDVLRYRFS
jgi:hypothetical protein